MLRTVLFGSSLALAVVCVRRDHGRCQDTGRGGNARGTGGGAGCADRVDPRNPPQRHRHLCCPR